MRDINKVVLMGRLGSDPAIRLTQNGAFKAEFPLATSRPIRQPGGDYLNETDWHQVVAWGENAEACQRDLKKGSKIYLEGRIQYRKYQDLGGKHRKRMEVVLFKLNHLEDSLAKPRTTS